MKKVYITTVKRNIKIKIRFISSNEIIQYITCELKFNRSGLNKIIMK